MALGQGSRYGSGQLKRDTFCTIAFLLMALPKAQPSHGNYPIKELNDFKFAFGKLDEQERIYEASDTGLERWEQTCLKNGGPETRDKWLKSQENMLHCLMNNFNYTQILEEIETKKATGNLGEVFQKYCGTPVKETHPCIEDFIVSSFGCTKMDKSGVNVTLAMLDAAVNYLCQNGDIIALVISESGIACVEDHWTDVVDCLNISAQEFFQSETTTHKKSWFTWLVFDQSHCRSGDLVTHCVQQELVKCASPIPSKFVSSMMQAIRNASPCRTMSARASQGSTSSSLLITPYPSFVIGSLTVSIVFFLRILNPKYNHF